MPEREVYDRPSDVTPKEGDVHMVGPDGTDVALTPEAALETSQRLLDGGMAAAGQRLERKPK